MDGNREVSKVEQQARDTLGRVRHVVLGLSGGADSVALLRLLLRLDVKVEAVHCNFHLRGEESDRDMEFCRKLCLCLGLPLDIVHFDVPAYEKEHGVSTEVACRELRYDYFRRKMADTGAGRIAVAHHADDNIETLLLNLFRGAGIGGLKGMLPDANGVIRPLLSVTRKEILRYLTALDQDYIVDSSNLSSDYRRNFIRNELLPAIETRWTGVRKSLVNTIGNLQADHEALEKKASEDFSKLGNMDILPYRTVKDSGSMRWLLHRWLDRYGARSNVAREIEGHLRTGRPQTGKRWTVKHGYILAGRTSLRFIKEAAQCIKSDTADNQQDE